GVGGRGPADSDRPRAGDARGKAPGPRPPGGLSRPGPAGVTAPAVRPEVRRLDTMATGPWVRAIERAERPAMAVEGSTKAVVTALAANLGIATSKFIAAAITGSASMLAEGVHSVADSGNQVLLLIGGRRARRAASSLHPFGYGRERYVYAFLVAIVLFTMGGLYAIYEAWHKISDPHELKTPLVAVAVLLIAIVLETSALRTAVRESNKLRGRRSWVRFVRDARAPELPVILLEDTGALVGLLCALAGVGLTVLTGNPIFDGIGTLAI